MIGGVRVADAIWSVYRWVGAAGIEPADKRYAHSPVRSRTEDARASAGLDRRRKRSSAPGGIDLAATQIRSGVRSSVSSFG